MTAYFKVKPSASFAKSAFGLRSLSPSDTLISEPENLKARFCQKGKIVPTQKDTDENHNNHNREM